MEPAAIAGRVVDLAPAWPPATDLRRDLLAVADDPETMLDIVETRLLAGLRPDVHGLDRCERAVTLLADDPTLPIADLAELLGVSHGHLDREFTRIVGLSPRRLARLLRVERLLARIEVNAAVPWADLAADLGWTDQSHLIWDVRRHTGTTPSAWLAARREFWTDEPSPESARFVPESM